VVGSSNYDMYTYMSRFPAPGETITGKKFQDGFGGKGANQAVCASILGAKVGIVTRVGDDKFGREIRENYERHGVDVTHVKIVEGVTTGIANIWVDDSGENKIVLIPGANYKMTAADVVAAKTLISEAKLLVCQNEITLEATLEALRCAKQSHVSTLFNPSPMIDFPDEIFSLVDIWCLNQTELELLMKFQAEDMYDTPENIRRNCSSLLSKSSCNGILLTLGSKGAAVVTKDDVVMIPPAHIRKKEVVDTTGAGDSFLATVAVCLAKNKSFVDAATTACHTSGETVKYAGCQASYKYLRPL